MEQRDYIIDEIQKIGKFITLVIDRLNNSPQHKNLGQIIEAVDEEMMKEFSIDIPHLVLLSPSATEEYLDLNTKDTAQIEHIVRYISTQADCIFDIDKEKSILYYRKAIELFRLIEKKSGIFSFENMEAENIILAKIKKSDSE